MADPGQHRPFFFKEFQVGAIHARPERFHGHVAAGYAVISPKNDAHPTLSDRWILDFVTITNRLASRHTPVSLRISADRRPPIHCGCGTAFRLWFCTRTGAWIGCAGLTERSSAPGVPCRPARFPAELKNQLHHQHFDLVAHVDVDFLALTNRVRHLPLADFHRNPAGQFHAAHVDDGIASRQRQRGKILRKLIVVTDSLVFHHLLGQWLNNRGGRQTRAQRLYNVRAILPGESFRHLASARIADAKKKYFFHSIRADPWPTDP